MCVVVEGTCNAFELFVSLVSCLLVSGKLCYIHVPIHVCVLFSSGRRTCNVFELFVSR